MVFVNQRLFSSFEKKTVRKREFFGSCSLLLGTGKVNNGKDPLREKWRKCTKRGSKNITAELGIVENEGERIMFMKME